MLKAIETRYRGFRFRSRAEARFAVYLDTAKVVWSYEPEGFDFDGIKYLPDFWVQSQFDEASGYWVEIKGMPPTQVEIHKAQLLANASEHTVLLVFGQAGDWDCIAVRKDSPPTNERLSDRLARSCSRRDPEECAWDLDAAGRIAAKVARFEHGESPTE
jgi:hypothetical protein